MPHPPYSPDLAPSDYHLFRVLKNHLRGRVFHDETSLKQEVASFFDSKDKDFYAKGISALESRLERVREVEGAYLKD